MEAYELIGLNGAKMTATFAKGGPAAQKAFNQVVTALSKMKDPVEQNAAAVGLFGTQAEDLEIDVITSLGNVREQFDMTQKTMEEVKNIKYDTLGMAFQGIARQIETGFLIPIGDKLLPFATNFSKSFAAAIPTIQKVFGSAGKSIGGFLSDIGNTAGKVTDSIPVKEILSAFKYITGGFNDTKREMAKHGESLEEALGPRVMKIVGIFRGVKLAALSIKDGLMEAYKQSAPIIGSIGGIFKTGLSIITPILSQIGEFALNIFGQISSFWQENGTQILQAVQNLFSGINKVIQFLAPVILFILNTVWGNVKGVIQGALSVILGVIKIFSGLFTGDFGKMWEGTKQLFVGAAQFIWNALNLLFIGKILGGIKTLATGAIGQVGSMWTALKTFFSGGATNIWNNIVGLIPKIQGGFSKMKEIAVNLAKEMWSGVRNQFDSMVQGATSLPGKIGSGIKSMGNLALKGITSLGNSMLSGLGNAVNGVIKGLNWVTAKIGIDTKINEWSVPQYAKGTSGHPGGLAILGDGGGPELFRTPQGFMGLSPGADTLMNLPKGTEVLPAKQTSAVLSQIPAYKNGIGFTEVINSGANWVKDKWENGKETVSKIKDTALNVFSYISNPSKLLNKVLEQFGVELPKINGNFGEIASGAFTFVKDKAITFLKDKLEGFSSFSGGVGAPEQVKSWLIAAINATGVPLSWLGPLETMAMRESGGNPRAINLWDINAKRGTPSKGLLQTIDPTFNAYKLPGMNDIWNPIHNAAAAIRYTKARYGTVFNTPGIRNMTSGGGYKGYYKGGNVPNTQWAWVGEKGPELMKIPGGSRVVSNEKSGSVFSKLLSFGKQESTGIQGDNFSSSQPVQYVFSPQYTIYGDTKKEEIEDIFEDQFEQFKQFMKRFEKEKRRLGLE